VEKPTVWIVAVWHGAQLPAAPHKAVEALGRPQTAARR